MVNKKLVKKRFTKNFSSYTENAFMQNIMALNLVNFLPANKFQHIFEVGCGTGLLTKYIKHFLLYENYTANDIVAESRKYIDDIIADTDFICGDIEEIKINKKFDLIISNACLQWCSNINNTIIKLFNLLNKNGILAFSIFGSKNLQEIKKIFNVSLNYSLNKKFLESINDCKTLLFKEEIRRIYFDNPVDILKHFKHTGTNAVTKLNLTKTKLKTFETEYKNRFFENNKYYITYNPLYIVIGKTLDN